MKKALLALVALMLAVPVSADDRAFTGGYYEYADGAAVDRIVIFEDLNTHGELDHDFGAAYTDHQGYMARRLYMVAWGDTVKVEVYSPFNQSKFDSLLVFPVETSGFELALDFGKGWVDSIRVWTKKEAGSVTVAGGFQVFVKPN